MLFELRGIRSGYASRNFFAKSDSIPKIDATSSQSPNAVQLNYQDSIYSFCNFGNFAKFFETLKQHLEFEEQFMGIPEGTLTKFSTTPQTSEYVLLLLLLCECE